MSESQAAVDPAGRPEVPDVPEVPEVPDRPDTPDRPDRPEVPDVPDEPEAPGEPGPGSVAGPTGVAGLRDRSRQVRVPSRSAEYDARRRLGTLLLPAGHLGGHADLAVWWAGVSGASPGPAPDPAVVVVLAADHGVAVRGVSALPLGWTAVAAGGLTADGGALAGAATAAGVPVRVVPVDVAGPQGPLSRPFDAGPALDANALDDAVDRGRDLLAELAEDHRVVGVSTLGVGGTTVAAALVGSALGLPATAVVTRGSGIDDLAWMRKTAALRDGLRRARTAGVGPSSPAADHLEHLGSVDAAVLVGLLVEAAARRVGVVVDGPVAAAAALLAQRVAPTARHWWLGVDAEAEPLTRQVWDEIGVARVATTAEGGGLGALLAVTAVRAAAAVLASPSADRAWADDAP
ncbi:MAG: nicotinate-nucleotide--dimethylbenzimidazole phosphoribosyltransferase [Kineosporiaceae bacterium]